MHRYRADILYDSAPWRMGNHVLQSARSCLPRVTSERALQRCRERHGGPRLHATNTSRHSNGHVAHAPHAHTGIPKSVGKGARADLRAGRDSKAAVAEGAAGALVDSGGAASSASKQPVDAESLEAMRSKVATLEAQLAAARTELAQIQRLPQA